MDWKVLPVGYLVLIFIACGARCMLAKEPPTIKMLIASCLWGFLVTFSTHELVVSWATDSTGVVNKGWVTAATALGAFLAKDILEILMTLVGQIRSDPMSFLRDWLNRNKPPAP